MRIGELSHRTGVNPRLLRYYEQQGLLTSERDSNSYRWYQPDAVTRVARIRELLETGLPTEAIRSLLPCTEPGPGLLACPHSVEVLDKQLSRVDEQLNELQRRRSALLDVSGSLH
ncbi:MerR family transcriptional regulator [Nocardia sp. XZ_19_385]|uniref:MerR family transcriptional regulator n=1 Tax=Nocardia sp. XZ_19_385 TaxID=2769488 RepID=UPI00188E080E|nr:MerR family transcriptional regulator [Nocardia sp. XZ_19_385]